MAILLPMKRQVFGFAEGLREAGIPVETQDELDFASDAPKVITYHIAKGLTFDTVLLPRLVPKSFSRMNDSRMERLLFVGLTRATRWAYLCSTDKVFYPILTRLQHAVEAKHLTLMSETATSSTPPGTHAPDDDLLDIL